MPEPTPQAPADTSAQRDASTTDAPTESGVQPRTTFEVAMSTIVDLLAIGGILAAFFTGRLTAEWLQALALVIVALLAGVRAADLVAVSKGAATRGGLGAIALAAGGAALAWLSSVFGRGAA